VLKLLLVLKPLGFKLKRLLVLKLRRPLELKLLEFKLLEFKLRQLLVLKPLLKLLLLLKLLPKLKRLLGSKLRLLLVLKRQQLPLPALKEHLLLNIITSHYFTFSPANIVAGAKCYSSHSIKHQQQKCS
jgi:hypothetical protein